MKNLAAKMKKVKTKYVWADHRKCAACWKCLDACPKQVIGKKVFLWHKHIFIKNAESCVGCKNCLKICPHGVFSEEAPDIFAAFLKNQTS